MHKILIVDDEILIRQLVSKYAKLENIETDEAENGAEAIEMVSSCNYDVIIMDIMMPVLDGFSAVKEIRKKSNVPVIMLSARSEEYDKIYGFDLGIDDYVTKPFSPKELLLRVKAIINRAKIINKEIEREKSIFIYQTFKVDFNAYTVYVSDEKVDLTPKEYELLSLLVKNVNNAVTREQLLESVWGKGYDSEDRTLDTHVKSLRKKIGIYGDNIITIRRVGYRFDVR